MLQMLSEISGVFPMAIDEEKRRIGREIKRYLAVNRLSREQFSAQTKLGKSTVDKLITGIFSEKTLQIVVERTNYVRSNYYAGKHLGGYSRSAWSGYLRDYILMLPSIAHPGALEARRVGIEWDDNLPGMRLVQRGLKGAQKTPIGVVSIPHERSPLLYVSTEGVDRTLIVSTMVGEPAMRGLMLTVTNIVANAYVPTAVPVVMTRLEENAQLSAADLGTIEPTHPKYALYLDEITKVMNRRYGLWLGVQSKPDDAKPTKLKASQKVSR